MNNIIEIINWIIENKEWLFSGMGISIILYFLGKKSQNTKKVHSIGNIKGNKGTIINGDNITK